MHFLRLLEVWWPGAQSAWDNHAFACNFANIYLPILKSFSPTLSNKLFLICLLTSPSQLKYVATLPCNLSLIACFMTLVFHKVMWQHMHGVVWLLTTSLLQIYGESSSEKKLCKSVKIWQNNRYKFVSPLFAPPCIDTVSQCPLID